MEMGGYFHDHQVPGAQYIEGHDSRDAPLGKISHSAETSHEHTAEHPAHAEPGIPRTNADYPKPTAPSATANTTQPQERAAKPTVLLIIALILQILAIIFLFATVGIIASASETVTVEADVLGYGLEYVEVNFSYSNITSIRYTLGTAVLGSLYCVYAIISIILRLIDIALSCKKPLLWISYIGDQVILILEVTGVTAAASSLLSNKDNNGSCVTYTALCTRLAIATGTLIIASLFLVFTSVISSVCACKRRI
ncbi:hypothetical protein KP509_37G000600 [Ceratopteris richardii]|uniref:CASP-like protein n=1 Tax=Ceratopteris richardii TaxID=49495 RepID=A0A8T2Q5T0_CERRI|nr:hypothetical protein KP509_37G000600 [Ceratopteris richardii]